ncbi:hypothetical protein [Wielerella bovis]|uniref:hypothetical protein n=1 Tax=Wielerella bovis TaxID=2917790 RepID=UPI002019C8D6|nr:hypothetical protein [Wielerella bovis]ULJ65200.1 hypothetical protein MIS33_02645 [Wielerella bovis]ULJ67546.1 hypothetical protein MIS31_03020 [Wielerella bovis]
MKKTNIVPHRSNRQIAEPLAPSIPVILVALSAGMIELINIASRESFKMPTTLRVGSANDLMKQCPFSHHRVVIDDETSAAEIFQAALKNSNLVDRNKPTIFVIRPQSMFVADLAKTELVLLINMVEASGYAIADIQFFLKDKIDEDDWAYLESLQISDIVFPDNRSKMGKLRRWFSQNL